MLTHSVKHPSDQPPIYQDRDGQIEASGREEHRSAVVMSVHTEQQGVAVGVLGEEPLPVA